MKFFAALTVGAIATLSTINANGVCYDPDHLKASAAMTADSVRSDMKIIKSSGFDAVRTYISKFGGTEIAPLIRDANLTACLGVPYGQSDYAQQVAAAIKAALAGGVAYIFVGNENLAGANSVPQDFVNQISYVKSQVPSTVKVGTVQRNTEVIEYANIVGWSSLVSVCDVIGVNIHPFFNPGTTADNAINVLTTQWKIMSTSAFKDKLLLTETGWPSAGSVSGNYGSPTGQKTFFSDYKSWSSDQAQSFYFQMFDTPHKPEDFEQAYGLFTPDSVSKVGAGEK